MMHDYYVRTTAAFGNRVGEGSGGFHGRGKPGVLNVGAVPVDGGARRAHRKDAAHSKPVSKLRECARR